MLIIPAIDLKDRQCVRLRQGRMEDSTVFSDDPVAMAKQWQALGARRLHIVDLNGAFAGQPVNLEVVTAIAKACPDLQIQLGGGIRSLETIETYLNAGIHYVIIGTQAVKQPEFVERACEQFSGHIMVGLDAKGGKVAINGWAEVLDSTAHEWAARFSQVGISGIIYTDIGRDGMLQGLNVAATEALARSIDVPVIASGGLTDLSDIEALCKVRHSGIAGVIAGRAIYEGTLDLTQAQQFADAFNR